MDDMLTTYPFKPVGDEPEVLFSSYYRNKASQLMTLKDWGVSSSEDVLEGPFQFTPNRWVKWKDHITVATCQYTPCHVGFLVDPINLENFITVPSSSFEEIKVDNYRGWKNIIGLTLEFTTPSNSDSPLRIFLNNNIAGPRQRLIAKLLDPRVEYGEETRISFYDSPQKSGVGGGKKIRTFLTPGKFFRVLNPNLTDKEVSDLVDLFRKEFPAPNFTLKVSKEAEGFKKAYAGTQARMENPSTTRSRKSLANSCLRGGYSLLPCHPAETYASGDFTILWTENSEGHVGSRCVVYTARKTPQAGPIYGVSEYSMDLIQKHLDEIGAVGFEDADWGGAKLRVVECDWGYVAPYIDPPDSRYANLKGDYLVLSSRGDYSLDDPEGVVNNLHHCCDCGEPVGPDDFYVGPDDINRCEDCHFDLFTDCAYDGEYYYNEEIVYVVIHSRGYTEGVHENNLGGYGAVFCEHEEAWYRNSLAVTNTHDNIPVSIGYADRNYALCEETDLYFPAEEVGETVAGHFVSLKWLEDNGWRKTEEGLWEPTQLELPTGGEEQKDAA